MKWNYVLVVMATWNPTRLLSTMYISLGLGVCKCFIHRWQCVATGISRMTSTVPVNLECLRYTENSKGDYHVSVRRDAFTSLLISVFNASGYNKQLPYVSGLAQQRFFPLAHVRCGQGKSLPESDLCLLTLREIWGVLHSLSFILLAKKQREHTQIVQVIF